MPRTPPQDPSEAPADAPDGGLFPGGPSGGAYQVLARKHRPRTFEDLVGQEGMVRTLANAFRTGRIAHAFMLTGVRGVGKTTTARLLARALNYRTETVDQPSLRLDPPGEHCAAIMASQHPDVLELDAASHNGVENMRELLGGARYAPVAARYKVYIVDEVHMLSTPAFNALLKTLEEPPPHVKFIFATTEIRKVPVTVLSRCQRFNLQRFSTEALVDHLANICRKEGAKASAGALALIARAAEGSARDALSILDQAIVQADGGEATADLVREMLGLADRSRILDLLDLAVAGDHRRALAEAEALLAAGADPAVLVKDLMDAMTEVSRAQALGETYAYAGPADWAERTLAMARRLSPAQAARMWRLLLQGFEDCGRAPEPAAAAAMVVLRLAAAAALPPPEDAARLLQAQRSGPAPDARPGPASSAANQQLSSLSDILAALAARREIDLKWSIERYVRPVEIAAGRFVFAPAPGAPADLAARIKAWLETETDVEWRVSTSDDAGGESPAERKRRRQQQRLAAAAAHPRVAEALRAFPGAKVLSVESPLDDEDLLDEPPSASNVIHIDFRPSGGLEPAGSPEEDDDA
jgi:DNA polymerase III subunit gamma/tau